jgi:hypothetical protein
MLVRNMFSFYILESGEWDLLPTFHFPLLETAGEGGQAFTWQPAPPAPVPGESVQRLFGL